MLISFLKIVPRKYLSHFVGWVVHLRVPIFSYVLKVLLIKTFNIDTSEAEFKPSHYPSFGDYFSRKLCAGAREIESSDWVSPCDGKLVEFGNIVNGQLIQCKGLTYSLPSLLKDDQTDKFEDGLYMTIYLAPHNYHRVHVPCQGSIVKSTYIEGDLWPVNESSVRQVPELFCVNERSISYFQTDLGSYVLIMVGATNVGSIKLNHLKEAKHPFDGNLLQEKASEYGLFTMGSTVILILDEQLKKSQKWNLNRGKLVFGQALSGKS